jgi:Peptidase family M28
MIVSRSTNRTPEKAVGLPMEILNRVSADDLMRTVEAIAFPRHYVANRKANRRVRDFLRQSLRDFGYEPTLHGEYDNVVVRIEGDPAEPSLLLGAHYDSVPDTPGADDNGSAVAVVLECARRMRELPGHRPVTIVFFNREEDGLLGAQEFVADIGKTGPGNLGPVGEAHIFEMVGVTDHRKGSQRMPPGVPGFLAPDVGDFLGLLSNRGSNALADRLLTLAAGAIPRTPVLALKVFLGLESRLGHLQRSDHAPFWAAGIPAVMWTDTSEFRNPHYHQPSDTPDTLDSEFMADVARLALARVYDDRKVGTG